MSAVTLGEGESRASIAARRFLVVALSILSMGTFDFIISDWNMPKMTGLELLRAVRADVSLSKIPLLLITAEARKENIVDAVKAGADGYIVKPFSSIVLGDKIRNFLKRRNGT